VIFDQAEDFAAQHSYRQRVSNNSNIEPRHQNIVEEILGNDAVAGVRARNVRTREVSEIHLAGVFVYVGMKPNTEFLKEIVKLSNTGHVPTDGWMKTERPGLYAIGDIRQDSAAQAIAAAGDGATAAIAAYRYIRKTFNHETKPD
jgi:thioredoxin reductase (NADPH)